MERCCPVTSGHLLLFTVMFVTWVPSNRKQSHYELEAGISTSGKEREQELVKSRGQEPTSTEDSLLVVNIAISSTRSWCAPPPPPARSTGKHPSGTQLSNRFQTPTMRTRPSREPETPNPQPGHPTTHHDWKSPIMQHGNTRTSAQTALSTEPSLTTSKQSATS